MAEDARIEEMRAKRYLINLFPNSTSRGLSLGNVSIKLTTAPDGQSSAASVTFPQNIIFPSSARKQAIKKLADLQIHVTDAHRYQDEAPVEFTLSSNAGQSIITMLANAFLEKHGPRHSDNNDTPDADEVTSVPLKKRTHKARVRPQAPDKKEPAAKRPPLKAVAKDDAQDLTPNIETVQRHISKLIYEISGKIVNPAGISVQVKPYADQGSYLEISVPESHAFSWDHRSCIANSIIISHRLSASFSYVGIKADRPLTIDVSPPYTPEKPLDGNDAIRALAAQSIQAYEWNDAGQGYRPKEGRRLG